MSEERKFKASHFENIQELIASCMIWIKTDDYDAYCRFFDMGAMEELIKELNSLKEIEQLHQEENGKLRVELEQEKEKNSDLKYQLYHKQQMIDELTQSEEKLKIELRKEKERNELFVASGNSINLERHIKNNYISKDKIMEFIKGETKEETYNFKTISAKRLKEFLEEK